MSTPRATHGFSARMIDWWIDAGLRDWMAKQMGNLNDATARGSNATVLASQPLVGATPACCSHGPCVTPSVGRRGWLRWTALHDFVTTPLALHCQQLTGHRNVLLAFGIAVAAWWSLHALPPRSHAGLWHHACAC